MSPSEEVNSAEGSAPARVKLLNQKRAELTNAIQALSEADRLLDTDAVIAAKERVNVLRGFISRLETAVRDELEVEGARRAKAWQKKNAKELVSVGQKIKAAQDVVRETIKAAVDAIKAEAALRVWVEQQSALADEVLSARFGLSRSYTRGSVPLPEREDWVMPILLASDAMRPERIRPRGLIILTQASDTPETRRRNRLKAVAEFDAKSLPAEVQSILAEAPIDPDILETPAERAHREASAALIGTGRSDPVLAQAAVEAIALSNPGMLGGHAHRG
jgi:hypothetical protein